MRVTIDPTNDAVSIEGTDISAAVRRVSMDMRAGHQPELFLELAPGRAVPDILTSDAVVHVVREGVDVDTKAIVLAWLQTLDPGMIERALLEDATLTDGMGAAVVVTLTEMAGHLG